jgi:PAS domain S-box-containing protein
VIALAVVLAVAVAGAAAVASRARRAASAADSGRGRYELLTANLPDVSVLLYDRDLCFTKLEGAALEAHGWRREEIEGRPIEDVIPAGRVEDLLARCRAALAGEPSSQEWPGLRDGAQYQLQHLPVRDPRGAVSGGMIVIREVSEQLRLQRALEAQGIVCRLGRSAARIEPDRVMLDDGEELPATRVIVAAGVRAETSLAREAGIVVERGIVVDDALRTSAPAVWSVGECAEHRGVVYGLWSPLAEQARVAGAGVAGDPAAFHGAVQATTLKVSGIDVYAGGVSAGATPAGHDEIVLSDTRRGIFPRLVLDGERLTSAALVGDVSAARRLTELLRTGDPVPSDLLESRAGPGANALAADPSANVCSCNAVSVGDVQKAIRRDGLTTVAQVGRRTRATTGCGGCTADIEALLRYEVAARV